MQTQRTFTPTLSETLIDDSPTTYQPSLHSDSGSKRPIGIDLNSKTQALLSQDSSQSFVIRDIFNETPDTDKLQSQTNFLPPSQLFQDDILLEECAKMQEEPPMPSFIDEGFFYLDAEPLVSQDTAIEKLVDSMKQGQRTVQDPEASQGLVDVVDNFIPTDGTEDASESGPSEEIPLTPRRNPRRHPGDDDVPSAQPVPMDPCAKLLYSFAPLIESQRLVVGEEIHFFGAIGVITKDEWIDCQTSREKYATLESWCHKIASSRRINRSSLQQMDLPAIVCNRQGISLRSLLLATMQRGAQGAQSPPPKRKKGSSPIVRSPYFSKEVPVLQRMPSLVSLSPSPRDVIDITLDEVGHIADSGKEDVQVQEKEGPAKKRRVLPFPEKPKKITQKRLTFAESPKSPPPVQGWIPRKQQGHLPREEVSISPKKTSVALPGAFRGEYVDLRRSQKKKSCKPVVTIDEDLSLSSQLDQPPTEDLCQPNADTNVVAVPTHGPVVLGTGLKSSMLERIRMLVRKIGGRLETEFSEAVTHVVALVDGNMNVGRTIKYSVGVLSGAWVVSYDWILESFVRGCWVDESSYEVLGDSKGGRLAPRKGRAAAKRGDNRLFSGLQFYLHGDFQNPSVEELAHLITVGEGMLVSEMPRPPRSTAEILSRDKTVIVCHPLLMADSRDLYFTSGRYPLDYNWVLDSVSHYTQLDFSKYRITPQAEITSFMTQNSLAY